MEFAPLKSEHVAELHSAFSKDGRIALFDWQIHALFATIRKLQSDFAVVDEALTVSEHENERLRWQFNIIHDALSEIVHGADDPRQVASDAFSKIAKGANGNG